MLKFLELVAFFISTAAFGYGAFYLFRSGIPKLFKLYVCAAGCYMLEELWAVVNTYMGYGIQDGLITVRLFGIFGCLCFMLSANINEFDRVVDEGRDRKSRRRAMIAPAVLVVLFGISAFCSVNTLSVAMIVIGFISISPALPASFFSLKHLLLEDDSMGFLKAVRETDFVALVFYAGNFLYPLASLYWSRTAMCGYDMALAVIISGIMIMCRKGAVKWETLI